jgi:thiol-disulfide isomerase/thioredoxin
MKGPLRAIAIIVAAGVVVAAREPANLEGQPAPRVATRVHVGPRVPSLDELRGKVVLLFFWAHWCPECRAESPIVAELVEHYRAQGLSIIAPTQRYGYAEGGRPAAPDKELRFILQVRDAHYGFLRNEPVPLGDANYKAYDVDIVPTHVLIDREGIVRFRQPGRMTREELDAAIRKIL